MGLKIDLIGKKARLTLQARKGQLFSKGDDFTLVWLIGTGYLKRAVVSVACLK
jgi:hypothetical protein